VPLHVLGHVEADQLDAHAVGELARDFGLSTPVGPLNRKLPIGFLRVAETRARHPDSRPQRVDRGILAEHDRLRSR